MKIKKIFNIIIFVMMFSCLINFNTVYAIHVSGTDGSSVEGTEDASTSTASEFPIDVNQALNDWNSEKRVVKKTESILGTIINVIRTVALGIAIIMLTIISIKYMTASPEGKAEYKKTVTGFVVGAVILFATSGILTIIKNVTESTLSSTT